MLKFKLLLWALTKLLQRAAKNNPACAKLIENKNLIFQIQTLEGAGRYFTISNGRINSSSGLHKNPKFTLMFKNASKGFSILSAKDSKDAFLTGLRTGDLVIHGDFVEVMWFQVLTDFLQPSKKHKC